MIYDDAAISHEVNEQGRGKGERIARKCRGKKRTKKKADETFIIESDSALLIADHLANSRERINSTGWIFESSLFILHAHGTRKLCRVYTSRAFNGARCQRNASDSIKRDITSPTNRSNLRSVVICSVSRRVM